MSEAMDAFKAELAGLRARYVKTLPEATAQLRQAWADCGPGPSRRLAFSAAMKLAHRLASASATFGLRDLARAARELEEQLQALVDLEEEPTAAACESVSRQLDVLQIEAESATNEVQPPGEPEHPQ